MDKLVPDAAVQAIQDSVKTETLLVGTETYTTRPVFDPPKDSVPDTLLLNTLQGVVNYVNTGPDLLKPADGNDEGLMVIVSDHQTVRVASALFGRAEQRKFYAKATAGAVLGSDKADFKFGYFYDCEEFVIKLQALFEDYDGRAAVLSVVGNIKEEHVRNTGDDGVTQTVIAKTGIARVGEVPVPNPVYLAPYRTFREISQPLSPFVLRMRKGDEDELPTCALFEADGGKWRLDAIESIREFLTERITGVPIIA